MIEDQGLVAWPSELRVRKNGLELKVTFEDGASGSISSERLRDASPSADNKRPPASGRDAVAIVAIDQIGNYAARIRFSDGHDTGIYSWKLLRTLTTQ